MKNIKTGSIVKMPNQPRLGIVISLESTLAHLPPSKWCRVYWFNLKETWYEDSIELKVIVP